MLLASLVPQSEEYNFAKQMRRFCVFIAQNSNMVSRRLGQAGWFTNSVTQTLEPDLNKTLEPDILQTLEPDILRTNVYDSGKLSVFET